MGQCKHHPHSSTEGVCPSCLQKKLKSVRWGETGCSVVAEKAPLAKPGTTTAKHKPSIDPVHPKEAIAILGSIASIKKRNHRGSKPGRDITEAGLDFVLDSRYSDGVTKPLAIDGSSARVIAMPGLLCPPSQTLSQNANAKDRKRWLSISKKPLVRESLALADSKPLVDRIAKETAMRVIREVRDEMSVECEGERERDDVALGNVKELKANNACFSPSHWRSRWGLKGIVGSPMITSSNKIFPSKQLAENKSHFSPARDGNSITAAGADQQLASGDRIKPGASPKVPTQEMVIVDMPDRILKPEDMNQRLRTSYNTVLQWLEDLPVPETMLFQKIGDPDQDPYTMDLRNSNGYQQDLAVVGHLHEIAEEHEMLDEESSSAESEAAALATTTGNHLDNVSSFGKFLIRAAQRQPKQGLSRVQARATALTAR